MSKPIFYHRPATPEETQATANALLEHSQNLLGVRIEYKPFGMLAYKDNVMIGSIIGKIFLNWLHLDLVWVAEPFQRKGLGKKLMMQTVLQAKLSGLDGLEVWTQSWQATEFYRKMQFSEMEVLPDFLPNEKRHVFRYYINEDAKPEVKMESLHLPALMSEHFERYFHQHAGSLPSSGLYGRMLPLFEKSLLEVTLKATKGNQIKAAAVLGINRNTLHKKIKELNITL